jgi:lactoylglutathione lyase
MPRSRPRLVATVLAVRDLGRARAFYEGALRMSAEQLSSDTLRLGLGGERWLELRKAAAPAAEQFHGNLYGHVAVGVPDLRHAFMQAVGHGAEVIRAPGRMVLGGPLCAFIGDPDGHAIELVQSRIASAAPVTAFIRPSGILGPDDGTTRLLHTNLRTRDMAAALRFWTAGLGMVEIDRVGVDLMGGVTSVFVAGAELGEIELSCFHVPSEEWRHGSGFIQLCLAVPGLQTVAERLTALGFAPARRLEDKVLTFDSDGRCVLLVPA